MTISESGSTDRTRVPMWGLDPSSVTFAPDAEIAKSCFHFTKGHIEGREEHRGQEEHREAHILI